MICSRNSPTVSPNLASAALTETLSTKSEIVQSAVRAVVETRICDRLRLWFSWRDATRETKFVRESANRLSASVLKPTELRAQIGKPQASTFFILGSGASVEDLDPGAFREINSQVSVGINAWPLHSFVPDLYAFEPVPEDDSDHYRTMSLLARPDILAKQPRVLFLKPRTPIEVDQFFQIPVELRSRTLLYGRFQPFTRGLQNLASDLDRLLARIAVRDLPVVPDSGASIVRMAALGILMGFKRVVFVGVDLNNTKYFWERNPAHLDRNNIKSFKHGQKTDAHETLSRTNRPFIVTEMVKAISVLGDKSGLELFVASAESELALFIDTYHFNGKS